ncbi:DUF6531 domain-containing protein, partial [Chlamydiales bacterium]|nr:DUF6531 domain-containing protein [Chlamydiales bacterium]
MRNILPHVESSIFYSESLEKGKQAQTIESQIIRRFDNVDTVVQELKKAAHLYDEAAQMAQQCYSRLTSSDTQRILREMIEIYSSSASCLYQDAEKWPDNISAQKEFFDAQSICLNNADKISDEIKREFIESIENEEQKRSLFFEGDLFLHPTLFFQNLLHHSPQKYAIPLDGQKRIKENVYSLFKGDYKRFLVHSETCLSHFFLSVYEGDQIVHQEKISLPRKGTFTWEKYLISEGMIYIPETFSKEHFGLEIRLSYVWDSKGGTSLIIGEKGHKSGALFSIGFEEENPLFRTQIILPPPMELGSLKKPQLPSIEKPIKQPNVSQAKVENQATTARFQTYPQLNAFVKELHQDPLLLAQYVLHEIAFYDPFLSQEEPIFLAPGIQRDPLMVFLTRQGTPWEQCWLLVYLLREAGYEARFAFGPPCTLPKDFAQKMLFTTLPDDQEEAILEYPWVVFFNGNEWVSVFPWMKEMHVEEGYELYHQLPDAFSSPQRFVMDYIKKDERIYKHVGHDGDDSARVLFVKCVEEELRNKGLSLQDVGIHQTQIKKQMSSWDDFPRPHIIGEPKYYNSHKEIKSIEAKIYLEISPSGRPLERFSFPLSLDHFNCEPPILHFDQNAFKFCVGHSEMSIKLKDSDQIVDVKVIYELPIGDQSKGVSYNQKFSITRGTTAALCFHHGGQSSALTTHYYEKFKNETVENRRQEVLLSFVGAAYFEKCQRSEEVLSDLHKVRRSGVLSVGFAKLSPSLTSSLIYPQVDMIFFDYFDKDNIDRDKFNARNQYRVINTVDQSSNEHQIIREIFDDPKAVSTIKLLQIAYQQYGLLLFGPTSFKDAVAYPEAVQSLYFSDVDNLQLRQIQKESQWSYLAHIFQENSFLDYTYAFMTPGKISIEGDHMGAEMGTLIFHPEAYSALISNGSITLNGGLGAPLPDFLSNTTIKEWKLTPYDSSYTLSSPPPLTSTPGTIEWKADVRPGHQSVWNTVADPVDIITGAFYLDEQDLILPGPFPIEIRRNYNSQHPLLGSFGCGWKLGLNPLMIKQEGKRYIAELDGTVIVYEKNHESNRFEVSKDENLNLNNMSCKGIGGMANPYNSYIEDEVLYGADGSKRFFNEGLLSQWVNARGDTLTFSYSNEKLSKIESSNGDFCRFLYHYDGKIAEISLRDGRRVTYSYDSQGDLIRVVLPNEGEIRYDYDAFHQIIRETKPHGRVLENCFDEQGRVKEQRSPLGVLQQMVASATFDYQEGKTTVTDAGGGTTTYSIFKNKIYKIVDPAGYQMMQAWFIDEKSWFDPEQECVLVSDEAKGFPRSLKATIDKRGLVTSYSYDKRGNPTEIQLSGGDISSPILKKSAYNNQNLCTEERTGSLVTKTIYDEKFPYLPHRIEKYFGEEKLLSYIEYTYNAQGLVIEEDHSGSITFWDYDHRGYPLKKTQCTGTDDPNVITEFSHSLQGQCIKKETAEGVLTETHDLAGNLLYSRLYSPSGVLLSADYMGYNRNNQPIWHEGENSQYTLYFDYYPTGDLKATIDHRGVNEEVAYTLYSYDLRGNLIEQVDPLGYCTYRTYDVLNRLESEMKQGLRTSFTYEPGGLLESVTSPSGATTQYIYTTNGLLKQKIFPDGTEHLFTYDLFGRPISETKQGMTWVIDYDDCNHQILCTHQETGISITKTFDARGNLIRELDEEGYLWEKTYDGLNRLISETTPNGETTYYHYLNNQTLCTNPHGEKTIVTYEGKDPVQTEVLNQSDELLSFTTKHVDPEINLQTMTEGDQITKTWFNRQGKPLRIEQGKLFTSFYYDLQGNCTRIIDGEGRETTQKFDSLKRVTQKKLPNGTLIGYVYDEDSNLIESHLPNNTHWIASYDEMGRKRSHHLQSGSEISQKWNYFYTNGYLTEALDPLNRLHVYKYDTYGRLSEETVGDWKRQWGYNARSDLIVAEQKGPFGLPTLIERSYDPDGHMSEEKIWLDNNLLQHTTQQWDPSHRFLQIEDHQRAFTYENNHLTQLSSENTTLSYAYNLNGALSHKKSPLTHTELNYNKSLLPEKVYTHYPGGVNKESLSWDHSGKLSSQTLNDHQREFTYTPQGYLKSAGEETYSFDFNTTGTGVRTEAPLSYISQQGLDPFGKIIEEVDALGSQKILYDPMGQVTSNRSQKFQWDPWGRLIEVT